MPVYCYQRAGGEGSAFGCLVDVGLCGKRLRVIYQLPGGGQPCAVVHYLSGRVLTEVLDGDHRGYPQMTAQVAVTRALEGTPPALRWWLGSDVVPLNPDIPRRVDTFGAMISGREK